MMTTTVGWQWSAARPRRRTEGDAVGVRAYRKAMRAAEQAAWIRRFPGVERARWEDGSAPSRRMGAGVATFLLLVAMTGFLLLRHPEAVSVMGAVMRPVQAALGLPPGS